MNRFTADFYLEHVRLVAFAFAVNAPDELVAEKLHLHFFIAETTAAFAASCSRVKGKCAGGQSGCLGAAAGKQRVRGFGQNTPTYTAGVERGVRASGD